MQIRQTRFRQHPIQSLLWPCLLALHFLAGLAGTAYAQEKQLIITTEPSITTKLSTVDGKTIFGSAADKVHEIMRRTQIPYQMKIMSWNRAFELARTQSDTCVFETARTPEREKSFKWIGPLSKGEWGIYGRPEYIGKVNKLSDIRDSNIGGYLGDAVGEYLMQRGYHVINSYDDEITLKNLLIGRLDFWASDVMQAPSMIANIHATDKVALLFTFGGYEYDLACNPGVSDEWVELIRAKLKEIRSDGTEAKILAKYQKN